MRNGVEKMRQGREKRQNQITRRKLLILAGLLLLAVLVGVTIFFWVRGKGSGASQTKVGMKYLKSLESRDAKAIEDEIKAIKKEEQKEALENGELTIWEQFDDYAIMGDSRTMGFDQYGFLPSERILAHGGATIADIPDYMESLKNLNPANIFLCYGLNDVSIGYWDTPQEYVEALGEAIESIKSELPDATVYVNSIFPAQDPAFEQAEKWREIPDFNEVIKPYCEEKGYPYIDNTEIIQEHTDLYDDDGIHLKEEFYEYWAINMLAEVEIG